MTDTEAVAAEAADKEVDGGSESDDAGGPGGGVPARGSRSPRRSRARIPLISAIVVGCVAALLVAVLATSKGGSNNPITSATPLQGKPAPNISGNLLTGGTGSLWPANQGKWVVVDFFASWCVPCQQEQGDLVKFQNAHPDGDVVIVGVRFDDPDDGPLSKMMRDSGAKWPVIDDPNAKIDYSVTGPPESFLISPGGIVLVHIVGPVTEPQLQAIYNEAKLVVSSPSATTRP